MCFVFVAYSWTEHHLLSLRSPAEWAEMYGAGRRFHVEPALAPRLLLWLAMAAPVAATIAAWQVRDDAAALARLRVLALVGLVAAAGAGAVFYTTLPAASQALLTGGTMSIVAAALPALGFAIAWAVVPRSRTALIAATGLMVITLIAGALLRERLRLPLLAPMRPRVTEVGGRVAFVAFGALNVGLMVWAIRSALKHLARRD